MEPLAFNFLCSDDPDVLTCTLAISDTDAVVRDAENWVSHWYKEDPEARDGFSRLAQHVQKTCSFDEVVRLYQRDALAGRQSEEQQVRYACFLAENGDINAAKEKVSAIYAISPEFKDGFARVGGALRPKFRELAKTFFELDAAAYRISSVWRLNLAHLLAEMGDMGAAERHVKIAYETDPDAVNGFSRIGLAHYTALHDRDKLLRCYTKDRELGRLSPAWRIRRARLLAVFDQMDQAATEIELAYSLDETLCDGFLEIANVCGIPQRDLRVSLELVERDLLLGRLSMTGRGVLAAIYSAMGNDRFAEEQLEECSASVDNIKALAAFNSARDKLLIPSLDFTLGGIPHHIASTDTEPGNMLPLGELYTSLQNRTAINVELLAANARYGFDIAAQWAALARAEPLHGEHSVYNVLGAQLYIDNPRDALIQFMEIILQECYYFSGPPGPFIIDAGSNIGMAFSYFSWLYPTAKIIGFEPNPKLFELCIRSIDRNEWRHITLFPYALIDYKGTAAFQETTVSPMASSVCNIKKCVGSKLTTVPTDILSNYIQQRVDFLKLDIEGCESRVLEEVKALLHKIKQGFIEYHYNPMDDHNKLSKILNLLEKGGFAYSVQRQPGNHIKPLLKRPSLRLGEKWSCNVLFKRL